MNHEIPVGMGARNFSRIPAGKPVVIPCPNCFRNWATAQHHLKTEPETYKKFESDYGKLAVDAPLLNIYDLYYQVLKKAKETSVTFENTKPLKGLKVAVYYGCSAMYPKDLRPTDQPRDSVEQIMKDLGAEAAVWPWPHKCCSAFVSAVYPEIAEEFVTQIIGGAAQAGAECLVTTCAMCQMNVEMRMISSNMANPMPIFHLNQLMALYLGEKASAHDDWWKYHLVDPVPLLKKVSLWD
jgi:heterodisulfide reductase subunit B